MPYISLQLLHRWWHGFPMQVHIDRAGQRFGPYPIEQVNALLADGTLLETDLGWTDGMAEWLPLSQVQGVILPGQTPAAPPPPPVGTNLGGVQASGSSKKKLMIGVGATVGVLALAAVGFFVVKPRLSEEAEIAENEDLPDGVNFLTSEEKKEFLGRSLDRCCCSNEWSVSLNNSCANHFR